MADWLTLQQLSKKRGIPQSTLRCWKSQNYIASAVIDNVVMLDDESVTRLLNDHQIHELDPDRLNKVLYEKEMEREVILSRMNDELFLMKTQMLYQPLFHVLIEELSCLIANNRRREIFLAISQGEPIARVAMRHRLTYEQAMELYSSILASLGENTGRIVTLHKLAERKLSRSPDPIALLRLPIEDVFNLRVFHVLYFPVHIHTVGDLLQYTVEHGWKQLKQLKGLGTATYNHIITTLQEYNLITIHEDDNIELTPEVKALVV